MYVIIAYDINEERVAKVNRYLKRFLHWIQNSLFEGELTQSQMERIKVEIKDLINEDEDTVRIYIVRNKHQIEKINIGIEKNDTNMIL